MTARVGSILLLIIAFCLPSVAQKPLPLRGSFIMSFNEDSMAVKKAWPFQCSTDITKTGLEIKDDMNRKGVMKRIIYNRVDSTWLMLLSFKGVKQATRIQAGSMFSNKMKTPMVTTKSTGEKKLIGEYSCTKYISVSEDDSAVVWATEELRFDICELYRMLAHCGMMTDNIDDGTWYYSKKLKGMVLEVTSYKKSTGGYYSMFISGIKQNEIDMSVFDLSGYRITDIVEGGNCGPATMNMPE